MLFHTRGVRQVPCLSLVPPCAGLNVIVATFSFSSSIGSNRMVSQMSSALSATSSTSTTLSFPHGPFELFFCLTPVTACRAFLFSCNSFARACEAFPAAAADLIWVSRSSRSSCAVWRSEAFLLRPSLRLRLL